MNVVYFFGWLEYFAGISLQAARISIEHWMPMADSSMLATAQTDLPCYPAASSASTATT